MINVKVTNEPISIGQIAEWAPADSHGAGNLFVGMVRNINLGKKVVAVEYDSFAPLAETVFAEIAKEAKVQWGDDTKIWIRHAQGRLQVGEISVLIYVTTRHRDESYCASRYVIEEIKTRAPIWKKEFYQNGETEWVRGHALCQHSHRQVAKSENTRLSSCAHGHGAHQ
jgi:molybdopterin synthase catalytic subunit